MNDLPTPLSNGGVIQESPDSTVDVATEGSLLKRKLLVLDVSVSDAEGWVAGFHKAEVKSLTVGGSFAGCRNGLMLIMMLRH